MMFSRRVRLGLAAGAALTFGAVNAAPSHAVHQTVTGLTTGNEIVQFAVGSPNTLTTQSAITFPAMATDTDLVGIDYRPRGGNLFAQARQGAIYVLEPPAVFPGNWTATTVRSPGSTPFTGTPSEFGFDFNPAADRIRTVNNGPGGGASDNNYRFNPNSGDQVDADTGTPGTQADGDLAFAAGDVNAGDTPVIGGAAYTNNLDGTSSTALFDIDAGNDALVLQNPPNGGQLNTIGSLGVSATQTIGFDIETQTGAAYASLVSPVNNPESTFYRLDLTTGAATPTNATSAQIGPEGTDPLEGVSLIPVPVARFTNEVTSVSEDGGTVALSVVREGPVNQTATVNYATEIAAGDNATSGTDFTATSGTLTFVPGDAKETLEVPIIDDDDDNPDKTFTLRLSGPSASLNLRVAPTTQVQIVDEDDTQGPLVALVDVKSQSLKKVIRSKEFKYQYSCSKACSETSSFQLRDGTVLGTNSSSLPDEGKSKQVITLTKDDAKRLRKSGNKNVAKVRLETTFTDDDPVQEPYTQGETIKFKLYR